MYRQDCVIFVNLFINLEYVIVSDEVVKSYQLLNFIWWQKPRTRFIGFIVEISLPSICYMNIVHTIDFIQTFKCNGHLFNK